MQHNKGLLTVCHCDSVEHIFHDESGVREEDIELLLTGKLLTSPMANSESILGRFKIGVNDWYGIWSYNKGTGNRWDGIYKKDFAEALRVFRERTVTGSEQDPK